MAKLFQTVMWLVLLTGSGMALADDRLMVCRFADPPQIPAGASAKKSAMSVASKEVHSYLAKMESSLQCLDTAADQVETSPEEKARINLLYNNGVEQMEAIAAAFNRELKAFRSTDTDDVPPEQLRDLQDLTHH